MAYLKKIPAKNKQGYKWLCVMEGPADPSSGERRQVSRRADTKGEASKRAQDAVEALKFGLDAKKAKSAKFMTVALDWLETYALGEVKESTVRIRESQIAILNKHMANMVVEKVTHAYYQKVIKKIFSEDYTRSTLEGVHSTANQIMKFAIKNKLRLDNPCTGVVIPSKVQTVEDIEKNKLEDKYLEIHELEEFLKVTREHGKERDKEFFYLMAFSGLRPGEASVLKWSDLNKDTNEIRVTKTLYNPHNNMLDYRLTPPKTKGSVRTIDLDQAIIDMLLKFKVKQNEIHKEYKKNYSDFHNGNFIFCRANGYPYTQKAFLDRMKTLLRMTSITKPATPHIFRHTHISMLTEAGVDLPTIMKRVGHESPKTTLKIYTHITSKMKQSAEEKVKIKFGNVLEF
ncbi:integrase [Paenibacillus sp. PastF-3]|uniref:tyrosine-type recombinase/integrase n=1 Tax=Paenibacillus sp. PastF-3 TaxID=2940626 RepID=UPI002473FC77|nr:site-specific integrase [Paenibacillus sp. PastF-3]MDH6370586.1 integrase [Paenibacillus sp. PastF-3]